ncbi:hypothetical protein NCCP2222_00060 [Sporosarcina sp. NCCP-2222]|nr:hypothetical protein NCCP2222_00060 [Sporosarcina sp. NCCP-2222]
MVTISQYEHAFNFLLKNYFFIELKLNHPHKIVQTFQITNKGGKENGNYLRNNCGLAMGIAAHFYRVIRWTLLYDRK